MPDMSMCRNIRCPSRMECYRYRMVANKLSQSISGYVHRHADGRCDSFLKLMPGDTIEAEDKLRELELEMRNDGR